MMGRPEKAMGGGIEAMVVFGGWPEVKRWWFGVVVCGRMRGKEGDGEQLRAEMRGKGEKVT
jgi:hypothetical protein